MNVQLNVSKVDLIPFSKYQPSVTDNLHVLKSPCNIQYQTCDLLIHLHSIFLFLGIKYIVIEDRSLTVLSRCPWNSLTSYVLNLALLSWEYFYSILEVNCQYSIDMYRGWSK